MTRVLPRANFHSSKFIRSLAELAIVDSVDAGSEFAEDLGLWIHFADAIALSAVHSDNTTGMQKMQPSAQGSVRTALDAEFHRVQATLVNSITASCTSNAGKTHIKWPAPLLELPLDLAAAFAPYRRFYETHQRDMELGILPLRTNVRAAVAKASPGLKKLAELDAVLEKILRDRENKLLAKVPALLKKRFDQLFKEHQRKLADSKQADSPAGWTQAGGWLAHFCNNVHMLLLAELELRLQPTIGLIEALKQDTQ